MAFHLHQVSDDLSGYRPAPRRYAWSIFTILFALMVMDYIDRQIVVSMFSHLKAEWNLSDSQLGGLVSIVSVTVALACLPLAFLADRWSRVKSTFLMALIWSLATIACAFAQNYGQLLGTRSIVGLAEAAYGTVGVALLSSVFPARMRSTVLGAFLAAGMIGSVFGVVLGGFIAERWGWQTGFGAVGIPGLVLALLFLLVARDYKTVALPGQAAATATTKPKLAIRAVATELFRPRSAPIACLGAGLQLLVVSTIWAWLPSYINRAYHIAPGQAGLKAGVVVLAGGVGAVLWSIVADRLSVRIPKARLYVPAFVAVLTTVLMCTAFMALPPGPVQYRLIVIGGLVMVGTIGPVASVVIDVTHASLRATASSVLSLTQNLLGLAAGPLLTGVLSDRFGLQTAMGIAPLFCLLAAGLFLLASRTYESDVAYASAAAQEQVNPALIPQHA